jgi:hypothetical protein
MEIQKYIQSMQLKMIEILLFFFKELFSLNSKIKCAFLFFNIYFFKFILISPIHLNLILLEFSFKVINQKIWIQIHFIYHYFYKLFNFINLIYSTIISLSL